MSAVIEMTVRIVHRLAGGVVYGVPAAQVGEVLTVSFDMGTRLVAAGYAEVIPDVPQEDESV